MSTCANDRLAFDRADALHVHPINKLVQLRPDLGYLDDLDKKKRNEEARRKRRGGDDYSGSDDDDEDEGAGKKGKAGGDELKSVTVGFLPDQILGWLCETANPDVVRSHDRCNSPRCPTFRNTRAKPDGRPRWVRAVRSG